MQTVSPNKLVRKQFLVSRKQVIKLDRLAQDQSTSVAEVVRLAIDAYEPGETPELGSRELMSLVSAQLKETINATRRANDVLAKALKTLDAGGR